MSWTARCWAPASWNWAEFDGGVGLGGGREGGAEIRSFLHGVEDGVANFFLNHFTE